jgi:predicted GNAT family N-acyltransferase
MSDDSITIRETSVEAIRPLRHAVLRAGLPPEAAIFDGDDEPTSRHFGAFATSGDVVGCASIVQRPWEGQPAWRLRGMAISDELRGSGMGRRLLAKIDQIVLADNHSNILWCNARTPATGFYSRLGWTRIGDEFHIETAGPHFRMFKILAV